jgi:hypothetical protein
MAPSRLGLLHRHRAFSPSRTFDAVQLDAPSTSPPLTAGIRTLTKSPTSTAAVNAPSRSAQLSRRAERDVLQTAWRPGSAARRRSCPIPGDRSGVQRRGGVRRFARRLPCRTWSGPAEPRVDSRDAAARYARNGSRSPRKSPGSAPPRHLPWGGPARYQPKSSIPDNAGVDLGAGKPLIRALLLRRSTRRSTPRRPTLLKRRGG